MVTTIQQVLHPFFILCFITGLDFYPRKQSKIQWTVNLSILYSLIIWFTYIYVLYFITIGTIRGILTTLGEIIHEISTFTTIVSAIMCHYHRKRFTICLKKLAIVDDSLEELGTPKMYQKMHKWSKIVIIGWLTLSLFTNFYDSFWWLKENGNVYIPYALNHSVHINTLVDLLFISILWYVGTRFDKVNEHMQYLLVREEHGLRCTWEKPVIVHRYILYTDNYKRTLWILMHVHLELCRLARELNMIFGIQMTLEMTSCFLYLTGLCVWLCRMVMREYNNEERYSIYHYFRQGTWLLLFLLKLYTVNYMCENVSLKANQIDKIIHKLSSTLRYADVWKEICQFTLQITYHQLKFTGMGLFYFGNSFLRKLGTTVVTFVIIMRQMKIT